MNTLARISTAAALLICSMALGADKSGVSPNSISLPKGPGSIEGLGESFQPTLNTGTAKYGLGIKLPPGTAGHAPSLSLSYDGGGGNGPFGYGWSMTLPHIQRRTDKGIPTYGEPLGVQRPDTFITESREELVPTADGYFFCENESSFIRYRQVGDHWEGTTPNGTRLEFGITTNARIAEATRTFSWLLERETDTRGNVIEYVYQSFSGGANRNQKYVSLIRYGPGSPPWTAYHFVSFRYEDRPDWFEDARAGFLVRTAKRLKSIVIGSQGAELPNHVSADFDGDGQTDFLNRRYDLDYLNYAGTSSHWSLLARVRIAGADGFMGVPPAEFEYAVSNPPDVVDASSNVWTSINTPNAVLDNSLVDLIDLNADGLPDLLKTEAGGGGHTVAVNRGPARQGLDWAVQWANPVSVDPGNGTSWNFDLGSARTHLADMDGDGLADLVHKTADDTVFYFANRGRLGWSDRRDMSLQDSAPPAPFGNPGVRTADVDFDKRIDIIQSINIGGGVNYRVWFNLGNQSYSTSVTVEPQDGFDLAWPGVQIADCNGDRVPDIARIEPFAVVVAAGLGYGRFAQSRSLDLPDFVLDPDQIAKSKLTDVNGDGLADLVLERPAPGVCWYWLNLGNYTFDSRRVITGLPAASSGAAVRWADLNGNGTTDLIYSDSSAEPRLQMVELGQILSGGLAPNLLTRIANGIGRVTSIEYAPSTRFALEDEAAGRPWPDLLPFPVTVVSEINVSDSLGHKYTSRFHYHDGYYDPVEKQFRGFGEVEQIELGDSSAPTLVNRSHFDTGRSFDAMKGRLLKSSMETEDGGVFSRGTTTWADPPRLLRVGTNNAIVRFAHPVATANEILELGAGTPRRLESETEYDDYGNVTRRSDYGIVEGGNRSAFDDERITVTEFAINTNAWIVRLPKRQEVADEDGNIISRTESFYDDESFSGNNSGLVTLGNLTMQRAWITPSNATAFIKATRIKYDTFGNPIALLDPLASDNGDPSQGHMRQLTCDNLFHSYTVTETIHVGNGKPPLESKADYDAGLATLTSYTDFNGHVTTYAHDAVGRLTQIIKPGDTAAFPTIEYSYEMAAPAVYWSADGLTQSTGIVNHIETRALDRTPGTAGGKRDHYLITRQFIDGLGRMLMTRGEAEPAKGGTAPRVVIDDAVLFNNRAKPARVLNPFFTLKAGSLDEQLAFESIDSPGWRGQFHEKGNLISLDVASAHSSTIDYDATLRTIRTTNQDGTSGRTVHEPLVARIFDENDNDPSSPHFDTPRVQFTDGLGRLIRVDEVVRRNDDGTPSDALRSWTTRYAYDLNDALTRITDSQNNVKVMLYDGLKRKIWVNDPDAGVSTNIYDDAFNLIETIDAKGQRLTYTFDGANRLLTEDYHDETSTAFSYQRSPDVAYFYDEPADSVDQGDGTRARARNAKGRLAYVDDASGQQHTSFDARGRIEWTAKRIPDPQFLSTLNSQLATSFVSYTTRFNYDSMDRATRMTYPDNDQVAFQYNTRGLIERIGEESAPGSDIPGRHIIPAIDYLPSAQQRRVEYGNGVHTMHAYDSRLRLTSIMTARSSPASELVNFSYMFDGVSNIKNIEDQRPTSDPAGSDSRRNTQSFTCDDLYRLIRVQYNMPGPPTGNGGEINYRYDRIGNMLSQTSDMVHMEEGRSVTDLGTMNYGGTASSSNRQGRGPNDPPGPHALTSIGSSSPASRLFPYDANGNMTEIDGLKCTWDFKDRLVVVEDETMRAQYLYDYTDRRVLKKVWSKTETNGATSALAPRPTSVAYVGKHFEVREHDEPVKYVFNGETRVARITGSLSANHRIQRVRLYPGWNLVSLAVTASNLLHQLSEAGRDVPVAPSAAFLWNPATGEYSALSDGQAVAAGGVLWIKSTTSTTVALTGSYVDPTNRLCAAGGSFQPGAGLEVLSLSGLSPNMALWHHDPSTQTWQIKAPVVSHVATPFPKFMAPGSTVFVQADGPAELEVPNTALRIRYYHQDHLGSSSVITDGSGAIVEETAYYPFGTARHRYQPRQIEEPYGFTQKEQDAESGLSYFESRFLASSLSRFTRVDPLASRMPVEWLVLPQKLNTYGYVQNNPLRLIDPTGMDSEKAGQAKSEVLVMYGDDMYEHYRAKTGGNRTAYETALKTTYKEEAGDNANIVVKRIDNLKDAEDLTRIFKEGKYEVIVYNGHGSGTKKQISPNKNVTITPQDIHDALKEAKLTPKKMFFYGCNTEKSGFVRVLSELQPKAEIVGAGARIAQGIEWDITPRGTRINFRVSEDRDHNIIYRNGKETKNVRQVSTHDLQNAGLPRP